MHSGHSVENVSARGEPDIFANGGEMGALLSRVDWATTPLGPVGGWSHALRTMVGLLLRNRFPLLLWWGPQFVQIYNDAYRPIPGAKHPRSLGQPAAECWAEIWHIIGPMIEAPYRGEPATWSDDLPLLIDRRGFMEETHFKVAYSPVPDESVRSGIGGVLATVAETTEEVYARRQLATLRDLAGQVANAKTAVQACQTASRTMEANPKDIPCALFYLLDAKGKEANLVSSSGFAPYGTGVMPPTSYAVDDETQPWPVGRVLRERCAAVASVQAGKLPCGAWDEAPRQVVILPLAAPEQPHAYGVVIVAASPHRELNDPYLSFLDLAAEHVSSAIRNARSYQQERERAEKLAEIDRVKTAFFSNVSHEFRTPLTLMLAPIEDMRSQVPRNRDEGARIELLHRNALRLLKLVNTLLDFSRIEEGRTAAVYEPTDLSALTIDLASSFRSAVERAGMALAVDCPSLAEPFYVDHDMWEKIVLNLLSNAFKFTFEGTITVRLREVQGGAELEVADTGIGIEEKNLPRIFERFHRVEGARSRSHEGSGIGLALVQELVRLHGGELRVQSQLGEGTSFFVRILAGTAHLPDDRLRASRTLQPTAIGAEAYVQEALRWLSGPADSVPPFAASRAESEPRERILVVDDNADMRDYLRRLLRERWDVETRNDGRAALESIRRSQPDLVLTDVMMPGLDGFGLLGALRSDASTRTIPVIMLSARAGEDASSEGLKAGADDYLIKPFTARELFVRIAARLMAVKVARESSVQRANLYRAFMQAPFPVAIFRGPEHVVELANDATLRAWGEGPNVIGWPLLAARPEIRDQPFAELLDVVYRTGTTHQGREQLARLPTGPAGELQDRYFDFVYAPISDARGGVEGIMGCSFEVTEQVRAQTLLTTAQERLEELAERERAARFDAEEANRAKDDFLAMLGHELRNPLSPIMTAIQLLKLRGGDGAARELSVIERQTQHLTRLVDDLLDVSRITRGKVTLNRESVELADIVAAAIETASPMIENGRHRLVTKVLTQGLVVDVDRVRMAQVIANLLTNAAKYTPPGGRISVSAAREGRDVVIRVQDTGIGISAELLPRVFDLFVQARQTLARAQGGLGLGLAIVKNLVTMHGGSVSATSEGLGHGSTFTLRLPADDAHAATREASAQPRTVAQPRLARVLIVDDNVDGAEMLAEAVGALGYRTAIAHDGPQALQLEAEFAPQIALLDIGLPVMDGYDLAGRLRERRADLILIAITGYGQASDREQARGAGFKDHLTKPIDLDKLGLVLESCTRVNEERHASGR